MRTRNTFRSTLLTAGILALSVALAKADDLSGEMFQVLSEISTHIDHVFAKYERGDRCQCAAANFGASIIQDAGAIGMGKVFLKNGGKAIKQILSLGSGLTDLEELLEKKAKEFEKAAKDKIDELIRKKIDEGLNGVPPETYSKSGTKNGCDYTMTSVLDLAGHKFDILVKGDCHCQLMPTGNNQPAIRVGEFEVHVSGKAGVNLKVSSPSDWMPLVVVDWPAAKVEVKAECAACLKKSQTGKPTEPPTDGGTVTDGGAGLTTPGGGNSIGAGLTGKPGGGVSGPPPVIPPPPVPGPPVPVPYPVGEVCPECQVHANAVGELRRQLAEVKSHLDAATNSQKASERDNAKKVADAQAKVTALEKAVDAGPYSASSVDPFTGNKVDVASQPNGKVTITVTDPDGNVTVTTKDRPSVTELRKDLDAARKALDDLKAQAKKAADDLQKNRQRLLDREKLVNERLQDAIAQLEKCIEEKCRRHVAAADTLQTIPSLNTGAVSSLFQNFIIDGGTVPVQMGAMERPSGSMAMASVRGFLLGWLNRPSVLASTNRYVSTRNLRRPQPGDIVSLQNSNSGGVAGMALSLVASGRSSGEVLRLQAPSGTHLPLSLGAPDGLVLQPLKDAGKAVQQAVQQKLENALPTPGINGYCLNFAKLPPTAGTLYRIGDEAIQKQFAPVTRVLQAGRRLAETGRLHPDSDPAAYADAIRQWSIWSRLERWDASQFEQHFVEHARKNVEAANQKWTKSIEGGLRQLVPNRWRDITAVWAEADATTGTQP